MIRTVLHHPLSSSFPAYAVQTLFALVSFFLPLSPVRAEHPVDGLIVAVPATITSETTGRLRSLLHGPLKRFEQGPEREGGKFVVLCDFNPDGLPSESPSFGASYDLAEFLRGLSTNKGVRTIAYVHAGVRRHSVLPVLACSEIAFGPKGLLGPASDSKPLEPGQKALYLQLTRNRFPTALVRKLLEPGLEVYRVGDQLVPGDARPRPRGVLVPALSHDAPVTLDFELARTFGLAQQLAYSTLDEVRLAYHLPRAGLQRALDRSQFWRIVLNGPIHGALVEQTRSRVRQALSQKANVLLLELRCAGGDSEKAYELARFLAGINDDRPDNPVETIAWVTTDSGNLASLLAFACNRMLFQPEAQLGDFDLYLDRHPTVAPLVRELENQTLSPERRDELALQLSTRREQIESILADHLGELAEKELYPPLVARGLVNPALRIYYAERIQGGEHAYLSGAEYLQDQAGPKAWRSLRLVKPWEGDPRLEGKRMTLSAAQARELGIASAIVKDLPEVCDHEGITPAQVRTADADWLSGLADFLRTPWVRVLLVMVGITCLILELKMPGIGLPGVLSAICFVLFFWAHSQLAGQITWLALLLFVLGLILLALEIFVLPGFGVCGISGVLLVLGSLGLVAHGHWPHSGEEWLAVGQNIAPFGISILGALIVVGLLVQYLPHIPVLNRLMLRADENEAIEGEPDLGMHAELRALLGAIGVAATPLRPAGKTQFGEHFVDVVAEGGYIVPGTRVQVVEVEGNRVVVKEV